MHQANATVEVGLAVPGRQAATHGLHIRTGALAPLQQVWQHQAGQVDFVIGHHALQVINTQAGLALQALQGKAATHAQRLVIAADQRRITGQRLRRVGHPGRVVGVLHKILALQARQQPRREDPRLRGLRIDLPLARAA
ncbi:hypothetical protein D3C84_959850 [compost metagenome]